MALVLPVEKSMSLYLITNTNQLKINTVRTNAVPEIELVEGVRKFLFGKRLIINAR